MKELFRSFMVLADEFREDGGDKLTLDKKAIPKAINILNSLRKDLVKVRDKGGVTVVIEGDTFITAYNTSSYRRKRSI